MGNTKTIKKLSIAKTKDKLFVDWFLNDIHWSKLADKLSYSKAGIFKYKKLVAKYREEANENKEEDEYREEEGLYSLGKVFNVIEINKLIDLYNYYVEHPEEFEKPKSKRETNIEDQVVKVKKHMKDMNMTYNSSDKE